jgi:hypothetical protein
MPTRFSILVVTNTDNILSAMGAIGARGAIGAGCERCVGCDRKLCDFETRFQVKEFHSSTDPRSFWVDFEPA